MGQSRVIVDYFVTVEFGQQALEAGQQARQTAVSTMQDIQQKQGTPPEQQGKDLAAPRHGQKQQGQLLTGVADHMAMVRTEQPTQRMDLRSLRPAVHASKEEWKSEI